MIAFWFCIVMAAGFALIGDSWPMVASWTAAAVVIGEIRWGKTA